ncbi:MAG: Rossmann-like domain-containing protein [Dehalococcoidia bacterium]
MLQQKADNVYSTIRTAFADIVQRHGLESEEIRVWAKPLSPEEAIGNPEESDYPLVKGREWLMQAEIRGSVGQAFTDMYGDFNGKLMDVVKMELTNNFRRAIFISTLNAVMRHLDMADKTIHCKDEEPKICAQKMVEFIRERYGEPKIAFVGLQPRMVEELSKAFEMRVTDMDKDNIGTERAGVMIEPPENWKECLEWADIAIVTGTTVVNGTIGQFITDKPTVYYGTTISGVARLLNLEHFCYCGH